MRNTQKKAELSKRFSVLSVLFQSPFLPIFTVNLMVLLALIVYGGESYSADSYGILLAPEGHTNAFIGSYRFFGAFLYWLYSFAGHNPILNADVDVVFFILTTAFSSACLVNVLADVLCRNGAPGRDVLSLIILDGVVLITATNCWFVNILTFPECIFITAVGLSLCFFAVIAFTLGRGILHYIISGILAFCAVGVFQQFISVFFIYIMAVTTLKLRGKNRPGIWQTIRHYLPAVGVTAGACLVYYPTAALVARHFALQPNSRIALRFSSVLENIFYFISHQHSYLKGWGYFKTEFLTASFFLFGLVWLIGMIVDFYRRREFIRTLFSLAAYAAAYAAAYLPGLVSTSHTMRTMFALFSVFALFAVGILSVFSHRGLKGVLAALCVVLVVVGLVKGRRDELHQKTVNANSAVYMDQVFDAIDDYRAETGITVKEVRFVYDKEPSMKDTDYIYIPYGLHFMMRLKAAELGYPGMWPLEADETIAARWAETDFVTFDAESQLLFDGNTLLLVVY